MTFRGVRSGAVLYFFLLNTVKLLVHFTGDKEGGTTSFNFQSHQNTMNGNNLGQVTTTHSASNSIAQLSPAIADCGKMGGG